MKYKRNRQKIIDGMLDKYGYIFCQNCHSSNAYKFEVHHIYFRSEKPLHPELHNVRNLILVCNKCHRRFHDHKQSRNKLVEERNLKQLFK